MATANSHGQLSVDMLCALFSALHSMLCSRPRQAFFSHSPAVLPVVRVGQRIEPLTYGGVLIGAKSRHALRSITLL